MRTEIRNIQQRVGITAIYVTHDQSEAMALSDQIIIMNRGVVAQIGTPQEIYYHPADEFVADFIGEANFLTGNVLKNLGESLMLNIVGCKIDIERDERIDYNNIKENAPCTVVLRPEAATLDTQGQLECEVILSCFMGSYQNYHVKVGNTLIKITEFNPKRKQIFHVGEHAFIKFDSSDVHVLQ